MSSTSTRGQESLMEHLSRACGNCVASTFACFSTTKEKSIISKLQYDITSRKKAFGIDYMNILGKVTEDNKMEMELKDCLDKAVADISKINEEIKSHHAEVQNTNDELEKKIKLSPTKRKKDDVPAQDEPNPAPTTAKIDPANTAVPDPSPPTETPSPEAPVSTPVPTLMPEPTPADPTPAPSISDPTPAS